MTDVMKPQQGMPPRNRFLKLFSCSWWNQYHKELAIMVPMGWTSKPMYHLEWMATTYGLQTRWLLVTFDWLRPGHTRYRADRKNCRLQWQRKQFGTKYAVMIPE